ncbi:helix-turn-helix transcriptional regulator [Microbacterium hydrocarbonoxydans]|uniref:helix-turn-helix transcriptional regulator n=1 Tax=Microbacterium hydrocarbonoxydans TaxID=273678 RepID=UPI001AB02C1D|nr:LuxR C-terminal-related transcriptional regulator [Microbacterium hydrocarbonoxydans]
MPAFFGGPDWPALDAALNRFDFPAAAQVAEAETAVAPEERLLAQGVCLAFTERTDAAEKALTDSYLRLAEQKEPRAAVAATFLGRLQFFAFDRVHVANGWFARARSAAAGGGGAVERALAAFPLPACFLPDGGEREAEGIAALADVRQAGSLDLEAKLLADLGTTRVGRGRVEEGMTGLDESMAMIVSGQARSALTSVEVVCDLATACERTGDLERTRQWLAQAETQLGMGHWAGPGFLYAHCQASLGALLAGLGRWDEADAALRLAAARASSPHSVARVARITEEVRRSAPRAGDPLAVLTPREREVLALLRDGLTNAEMAARLHNSVRTIDHHVSAILGKLCLRSRTEAAVLAASLDG